MTAFSERRVNNWTFEAYGHIFPLPPDLVGRVKHDVPNRADRRRAEREAGGCTLTRPVLSKSERRASRRITAESTVDETATP